MYNPQITVEVVEELRSEMQRDLQKQATDFMSKRVPSSLAQSALTGVKPKKLARVNSATNTVCSSLREDEPLPSSPLQVHGVEIVYEDGSVERMTNAEFGAWYTETLVNEVRQELKGLHIRNDF